MDAAWALLPTRRRKVAATGRGCGRKCDCILQQEKERKRERKKKEKERNKKNEWIMKEKRKNTREKEGRKKEDDVKKMKGTKSHIAPQHIIILTWINIGNNVWLSLPYNICNTSTTYIGIHSIMNCKASITWFQHATNRSKYVFWLVIRRFNNWMDLGSWGIEFRWLVEAHASVQLVRIGRVVAYIWIISPVNLFWGR